MLKNIKEFLSINIYEHKVKDYTKCRSYEEKSRRREKKQ